tara:strand:+ start:46 stop:2310 length:2265 start_codon:yes stop_codon:yes gene_type:complete
MADDIDVLGQSLLNRTRTSRKRQQKQNRRDQNIALGLNLLNKGVGYANTYLKNRADTFVNEQEDLVGERIRQQQAINRSTQIMEDYEAAQAHSLGTVGWLAENKFSPIIRANFERDFGDTSKYNKSQIDNWVYDQAMIEAEKHVGSFEAANTAAMGMGEIEDYDAYVRTKDGRAENVGGFLFNKISRSLNDRTQEDIDSEVIESIRNNRFTNRADQVLHFDGLMKAGYAHTDAINIAKDVGPQPSNTTKDVLEGMGINEANIEISSIDTERMSYFRYGSEQSIQVQVIDYSQNGKPHSQVYVPFKDANGNYDQDSYNFFMNINNSDPSNASRQAIDAPAETLIDSSFIAFKMDPNNPTGWVTEPEAKGAEITSTDGFGRQGTQMIRYYYDKDDRSRTRTPVHSVIRTQWDNELTPNTPITDDAQQEAGAVVAQLENIMQPEGIGKNLVDLNLINIMPFGSKDSYDDAVEKNRDGTNQKVAGNRAAINQKIWWEAFQLEEQTGGELTHIEALQLSSAALLTPFVLAYDDEQIHNSRIINFEESKNVAMLIGESQLTENTPYQWQGTPEPLYHNLAIGALDDVINARTPEYQTMLVDQLRKMRGFQEILVPQTAMSPKLSNDIQMSGRPVNTNGDFTFEQMLTFAAGMPVQPRNEPETGAAENPATVQTQTIDNLITLRGSMRAGTSSYQEISEAINKLNDARNERVLPRIGDFIYRNLNDFNNLLKEHEANRKTPEETWAAMQQLQGAGEDDSPK